jgi:hypothetical protein
MVDNESFPFSWFTLWQPNTSPLWRVVRFCGLTQEAITTTPFGRAPFARWLLSWQCAEGARGSAAELKPP